MLMLTCKHCGAKTNNPTVIKTNFSTAYRAECRYCGQVMQELSDNEIELIKEVRRADRKT